MDSRGTGGKNPSDYGINENMLLLFFAEDSRYQNRLSESWSPMKVKM